MLLLYGHRARFSVCLGLLKVYSAVAVASLHGSFFIQNLKLAIDIQLLALVSSNYHDDVIKWEHFPRYWLLCGEYIILNILQHDMVKPWNSQRISLIHQAEKATHKDHLSLLVLSLVSYPGPLFLRELRGLFLKRTPVSLPLLTEEVIRYGGSIVHDDVIKWKNFQRYWPFVWGNHRSPVNSPHKCQWRGALMFSLFCTRINGWVNTREAVDLIRHRTHHDVIVMWLQYFICHWFCIHITKTSEKAFYVRKS